MKQDEQRKNLSERPGRRPMLLEVVRQRMRLRHLSYYTEKQYVYWIRNFVRFHRKRHPSAMGEKEIEAFLSHLAIERGLSPSTQNQALNALIFLFRHVLNKDLGDCKNFTRAKHRRHVPVVLTREEIVLIFNHLKSNSQKWLIAGLLYGCGLRLIEALRLRIKDIDFGQKCIIVRDSKGNKDRVVPLPTTLTDPLRKQIEHANEVHTRDLKAGLGRVSMPYALARKYPNADRALVWQYVFPSTQISRDPVSGELKRHHLFDSIMEKAVARAVKTSGVLKRVTCHTFRHSYATHLLESGKDIRTIQILLGHNDVKTTMIYTHVAMGPAPRCESPLDTLPVENETYPAAVSTLLAVDSSSLPALTDDRKDLADADHESKREMVQIERTENRDGICLTLFARLCRWAFRRWKVGRV